MRCYHLSLETLQPKVCAALACCRWAEGRNFYLLPLQRGVWASICCSCTQLSSLVAGIRTVLHIQFCHPGCARQNWGQDTCKALTGILSSQIPPAYGQEGFFSAAAYFVLGTITSKPKASAGTPSKIPNPDKPLPQRESSRYRHLPTAQANTI